MSRFWCFLGVVGLVAGFTLTVPGAASASVVVNNCANLSTTANPNSFAIAELPQFQIGPETYECILPSTPTSVVNFDMIQNGSVSDHVGVVVGSTPVVVTLASDGETASLGATAGATQVSETDFTCPAGFGPPIEPGGEGTCNGSTLAITFANGPGHLFVASDIAAVPEPPTGLILGAALPALLGLRRRSTRVSA